MILTSINSWVREEKDGEAKDEKKQTGKGVLSNLVKGGIKKLPQLFKHGTKALVKTGIKQVIK